MELLYYILTWNCSFIVGDDWIERNLNHWRTLHSVRSVISLGALTFMAFALTRD